MLLFSVEFDTTRSDTGVLIDPSTEEWMFEEMNVTASHGDSDMGRSYEQRRRDKRVGEIGEFLFQKGVSQSPYLVVEKYDGHETDFLVNGIETDVKARKGWEPHNDLLVRMKTDLMSKLYVQVIVHKSNGKLVGGTLTGFATAPMCRRGEDFDPPGTKHEKRLVPHEELRDMDVFTATVRKLAD